MSRFSFRYSDLLLYKSCEQRNQGVVLNLIGCPHANLIGCPHANLIGCPHAKTKRESN